MESINYVPRPVQVDQAVYMMEQRATPAQQIVGHAFAQAATQMAVQQAMGGLLQPQQQQPPQ